MRSPIGLGKWQEYSILNQKGTVAEVTTWSDEAEFIDMHAALLQLGFSEGQRLEAYLMLTCVLTLGNLRFHERTDGNAEVTNPPVLETCSAQLQVSIEGLRAAVTCKTIGGGAIEEYQKPLEPSQADTARSSLLMHIYSLVFEWWACKHRPICMHMATYPYVSRICNFAPPPAYMHALLPYLPHLMEIAVRVHARFRDVVRIRVRVRVRVRGVRLCTLLRLPNLIA